MSPTSALIGSPDSAGTSCSDGPHVDADPALAPTPAALRARRLSAALHDLIVASTDPAQAFGSLARACVDLIVDDCTIDIVEDDTAPYTIARTARPQRLGTGTHPAAAKSAPRPLTVCALTQSGASSSCGPNPFCGFTVRLTCVGWAPAENSTITAIITEATMFTHELVHRARRAAGPHRRLHQPGVGQVCASSGPQVAR